MYSEIYDVPQNNRSIEDEFCIYTPMSKYADYYFFYQKQKKKINNIYVCSSSIRALNVPHPIINFDSVAPSITGDAYNNIISTDDDTLSPCANEDRLLVHWIDDKKDYCILGILGFYFILNLLFGAYYF